MSDAVLGPLPDTHTSTRKALQLLATNVLTPARYRQTKRIGLRSTPGGFGTPPFGDDDQVRVEGTDLVVRRGGSESREALSTLGAACELALGQPGPDMQWTRDLDLHDTPQEGAPETKLDVDPVAAAVIARWFALGWEVLSTLAADGASVEASEPQLWPEHFDPAVELLSDERRAGYGFSPGDGGVAEPYAYVSLWYADALGDLDRDVFNSTTFPGALLRYSELVGVPDPTAKALAWMRAVRDALATKVVGG